MSVERKRLLVVDDEREIAEFVAKVANRIGFSAVAVDNAADFATQFACGVDVIVLDLFMPEMDGIEVIRFLAENQSRADLLLMSGVDRSILSSAEKLAVESGLNVVATLGKPFRKLELQEALTKNIASSPKNVMKNCGGIDSGALEKALTAREFHLVYQPQVRIHDRSWSGVEALLRWEHPTHGIISPEYFIPLAEECGMIDRITQFVVDEALSQSVDWSRKGYTPRVSINISARTLEDLEFPEKLLLRLREHGVPSERLAIELTETSVAKDLRKSLDILTRLRIKGFVLSIDDFGTGYSSMLQLVQAPFTELKVDRAFVGTLLVDSDCRSVVSASIKLAHELGMSVVAEGIESESVWNILKDLQCDEAQGFWIAKPMPGSEIIGWWEDWSSLTAADDDAHPELPFQEQAAG
jgi:EAL domain-containing protein (putative c-di-GMP-specific phosphodiesterase class I)/CheY-like chemotaxis protein